MRSRPAARRLASLALALALALVVVLLPVREALAWSRAGHMVHGALTYRDLRARSPRAARRIAALLEQHPHYRERWLPQLEAAGASGAQRDELLFMLAARWPDDLRGVPEYDHPTWHYVNFPLVRGGDTIRPPAGMPGEVLTELAHNLSTLRDPLASAADRAIAICWALHLAGDVHQPLHAVALYGAQWPEGDRGGNGFWVLREDGGRPTNLHSLWDGLVATSDSVASVRARATAIGQSYPRSAIATDVARLAPIGWARDESLPLARDVAYADIPGTPQSGADTPPLPEGYTTRARTLAERRVALAAYRLAALLEQAAED